LDDTGLGARWQRHRQRERGLGPRSGNAAEAIKLAKAGIRHLLEVERSIK
jgi:hypothetical protein